MHNHSRIMPWVLRIVATPALLFATLAVAQGQPAAPARPPIPAQAANASVPSDKDVADAQEQLIKLLRLSPTLTAVVAHDPSLLANQEYVSRNNPQLAQFLAAHPEIVRNPEFYLFTHLGGQGGRRDQALERAVWPELQQQLWPPPETAAQRFARDLTPVLGFACFLGALIYLIRVFLENRRWGRIFKLQSEVHGRLIDKFSSNQELSAYMETEAGKRFLEAAPIPVGFEPEQRMPNAVARVLAPLQIGIVLILLGAGFFLLRHAGPEMDTPMLVLGTVALMPGLGFIISAGVTWVLATRLGLMPEPPAASNWPAPPAGSQDRQ
ncbi:MAG: hypothetical protein ABR924_04575 [Terracidiphilus sp.]|jgi:hypothetical protein